jgi:hypothetical protein
MPQFNGKQGATRITREANLRCPRNGKRSDFAFAFARSRFALDKPLGLRPQQRTPGRRRKRTPPARIPANEVEPRVLKKRATP